MEKMGCPKGFSFNKDLNQCTPVYNHFPDWMSFQKIQEFLDNKNIGYDFDEDGLNSKKSHLDIYGDDDVMQRTPIGWDVDYSQDPECKTSDVMDFLAGIYPRNKWQRVFSDMFYSGPHVFTAQEKYNMLNMVKSR